MTAGVLWAGWLVRVCYTSIVNQSHSYFLYLEPSYTRYWRNVSSSGASVYHLFPNCKRSWEIAENARESAFQFPLVIRKKQINKRWTDMGGVMGRVICRGIEDLAMRGEEKQPQRLMQSRSSSCPCRSMAVCRSLSARASCLSRSQHLDPRFGTKFIPAPFRNGWLNTIPKHFCRNRFCQMEKSGKQMCC